MFDCTFKYRTKLKPDTTFIIQTKLDLTYKNDQNISSSLLYMTLHTMKEVKFFTVETCEV